MIHGHLRPASNFHHLDGRDPRLRAAASTWPRRAILAASVLPLVTVVALSYLTTGAEEEVLDDLFGMVLLIMVVVILLRLRPSNAPPLHWTDVALILVFWLPLEFFWLSNLEHIPIAWNRSL
jgi:hypothetical protein